MPSVGQFAAAQVPDLLVKHGLQVSESTAESVAIAVWKARTLGDLTRESSPRAQVQQMLTRARNLLKYTDRDPPKSPSARKRHVASVTEWSSKLHDSLSSSLGAGVWVAVMGVDVPGLKIRLSEGPALSSDELVKLIRALETTLSPSEESLPAFARALRSTLPARETAKGQPKGWSRRIVMAACDAWIKAGREGRYTFKGKKIGGPLPALARDLLTLAGLEVSDSELRRLLQECLAEIEARP